MNLFEPLWVNYYAQKLTAHELNQFRQAEARATSRLLTDVIKVESYDQGGGRYMAVSDHTAVVGRSHFTPVELKYGRAAWKHQCFFTNPLRIAFPGGADFNQPSERVLIGPHDILTFEFDTKSLAFFQQQLSWFRSPRKPLDGHGRPAALVVAAERTGPTGDDRTFWVTDAAGAPAAVVADLSGVGLAAELIEAAGGLKLFALAGYVQDEDARLAAAPGGLSGVIGAAPVF